MPGTPPPHPRASALAVAPPSAPPQQGPHDLTPSGLSSDVASPLRPPLASPVKFCSSPQHSSTHSTLSILRGGPKQGSPPLVTLLPPLWTTSPVTTAFFFFFKNLMSYLTLICNRIWGSSHPTDGQGPPTTTSDVSVQISVLYATTQRPPADDWTHTCVHPHTEHNSATEKEWSPATRFTWTDPEHTALSVRQTHKAHAACDPTSGTHPP